MGNCCSPGCRLWCLWWCLFVLFFFPRGVLDEILTLIASVSEGFPSYFSIPYNAKSCLKWLSSKGCNSVKIKFSSTKNPHAHFQYVHNKYARFQKDRLKLWEELITQTLYRKAWRTDGRTEGQTGANLNAPPPDYCHGGIKKNKT